MSSFIDIFSPSSVGLNVERIVLGDEVDRMTDVALGHVAEQTTVFARVSPMQKNRIIQALKRRGYVVGYLGDGINDAPSLHTADVGISVVTGTDVAREAAEVILLERSLPVLHQGIIEGRKAFGNVMKYLPPARRWPSGWDLLLCLPRFSFS